MHTKAGLDLQYSKIQMSGGMYNSTVNSNAFLNICKIKEGCRGF